MGMGDNSGNEMMGMPHMGGGQPGMMMNPGGGMYEPPPGTMAKFKAGGDMHSVVVGGAIPYLASSLPLAQGCAK
eukprot:1627488-Rhodomonas_salina.1